ncbi:DUF4129 domain-containing protein [Alkalihalobacillus sp. AL-G]|uniref:DUF4129 domain-containing protein n=1 Tax=Alkalihalobacillus sp. AL-G TaxID=2926399 RepID=UPI00272B1B4A|nr:DUF4129 domain-containing protein [Alkalihalobacillus sp. AL-G]WLD91949.1 DUF4129 domain-containing protein [Alkalihalobacillus sp. AL-G]
MSSSMIIRTRWLHYLMDVLLVALTTVWFYAPFKTNVMVPVIVLMVVGGVLLEFILPRIEITVGKVLLIAAFLCGIGWVMGLDWLLVIIVSLVCTWRFTLHFLDSDIGQEVYLFLFSVIGLSIFFVLYRTSDELMNALALTLFQFILLLAIRLNRIVRQQETNPALQRYVTYTFVGFIGVTGVIVAVFPLIKQAFMLAMKLISGTLAVIFYYPVSSFFNWLTSFMSENDNQSKDTDNASDMSEELLNQEHGGSGIIEWMNAILIIAAIIIVVWMFYKFYHKHLTLRGQVTLSPTVESHALNYAEPDYSSWTKSKAPENRVRKRLYQLERKMAKYDFGRFRYESVQEWLDRIDPPENLHDQITGIYQQVRYGEQDATQEQTTRYEAAIQKMLSWGKENHRIKMKKNKKK